jgi:hypothetical protein
MAGKLASMGNNLPQAGVGAGVHDGLEGLGKDRDRSSA